MTNYYIRLKAILESCCDIDHRTYYPQVQKLVVVCKELTPLASVVPSASSTSLIVHRPINHWHVASVTCAAHNGIFYITLRIFTSTTAGNNLGILYITLTVT